MNSASILAGDWSKKSSGDLVSRTRQLRDQLASGLAPTDDEILVPALALGIQSLERVTQMKAYDTQILAGIAMCHGSIAEMQTGEGKTLASLFPMIVHALTGQGVHVATFNSYLAERDFELIQPVLRLLEITAGISKDGASTTEKRAAYQCDVTFATGYELGFDFLRDKVSGMSSGPERLGQKLRQDLSQTNESKLPIGCQRSHAMAIIDEADSVLIDEGITPLVLSSGQLSTTTDDWIYHAAAKTANDLEIETDYWIDEKTNALILTEQGSLKAHNLRDDALIACRAKQSTEAFTSNECDDRNRHHAHHNQDPVRKPENMFADLHQAEQWIDSIAPPSLLRPWKNYIESALRARHIMIRDINYIVRDQKVEIVDGSTGRILSGRNWKDGLHQAVEAKESVPITGEFRTLARISRQRYFQQYQMLSGMTGTANGNQAELNSCYGLPIVVIPLRKPSQRTELPPKYYSSVDAKIASIVSDVKQRSRNGQPVLIGTRTIDQSIRLSQFLSSESVRHQVLNGIQDANEASLISIAGSAGSVTVATNMAGRGTDIQPSLDAIDAGGLHVVGFERNHSRRIDRQLLGRAGRQGDPGSGQFHTSADDEIVKRYDPGFSRRLRRLTSGEEGQSNSRFDRRIQKIQRLAERESYQTRCHVMREELWLDDIKKVVG